jgi:hypothetical protein
MNATAEKIARMHGKTTYKDFRQGFAQVSRLDADSDSDIKAALGIAQHRAGNLAVMALETHYASSLEYQRELRRGWDVHCGPPDDAFSYPVRRLGCSLAIIEHAGRVATQREVKEWAWMLHTRTETIDGYIRAACIWLDELTGTAARVFLAALREKD